MLHRFNYGTDMLTSQWSIILIDKRMTKQKPYLSEPLIMLDNIWQQEIYGENTLTSKLLFITWDL